MTTQPSTQNRNEVQTGTDSPRISAITLATLMLVAVALWLMTGFTLVDAAPVSGASAKNGPALRAQHQTLKDQLKNNAFNRPLVLASDQTSKEVKGDIYTVIAHPFDKVSGALSGPQVWCDILILHLNTKYCSVSREQQATTLQMNVGKKFDQPLDESYRLAFAWTLADRHADYLRVALTADTGPLSTHDYRITLEAMPLENGTTFLHLSYAYGFGVTGKIAMSAYFSTIGRAKVGFTVTGKEEDGSPIYIGGMRGLVERNTMRYYLAIEAYLGALTLSPRAQFEKRIGDWFVAAERYPRQLHEMEKSEYLDMKRKEQRRQMESDAMAKPSKD